MYDSWKDYALDEALDNKDLRERVKQLEGELNQQKLLVCDYRMRLVFAERKLRKEHKTVNPVMTGANAYECEDCCCNLEPDYEFCPGCGRYIDWHAMEEWC